MKAPIGTIKVDERLGLMSDSEGMKGGKKRDSSVCGICCSSNSEGCNIF